MPKIKGTHTAMKSGMLAAEAVAEALAADRAAEPASYQDGCKAAGSGRSSARAQHPPGFAKFGLYGGLVNAALDTYLFRGQAPWTLQPPPCRQRGAAQASPARKIAYPKPDGKLTFDKLSSVFISNTNHEENQPVHLRLRDPARGDRVNWDEYRSPESATARPACTRSSARTRATPQLQINAQNCVHCKTCDIKDPTQNIDWVPPEGAGGPNYPGGM